MTDKQKKGEFLLNELGNIDEDLLYEATDLYPAARKRSAKQGFIAAVCVACAVAVLMAPLGAITPLTLAIGAFIGIDLGLHLDKGGLGAAEPPQESVGEEPSENTADLLFPEDVNADLFFGGEPFLLTKESSEDCYRITRLSDSQYRKINNMMHHGQKRTEESPAPAEQIWICDGKGLVKSPHLEDSPGNEYYGQLFDYDAELILSKEMTKYLEDLTS
jgi:hypothetical protein